MHNGLQFRTIHKGCTEHVADQDYPHYNVHLERPIVGRIHTEISLNILPADKDHHDSEYQIFGEADWTKMDIPGCATIPIHWLWLEMMHLYAPSPQAEQGQSPCQFSGTLQD